MFTTLPHLSRRILSYLITSCLYLDAASKESGARGRGAGRDGNSLHARAEVHVGQVVAHVFRAAPDLVVEVASAQLPLVVLPETLFLFFFINALWGGGVTFGTIHDDITIYIPGTAVHRKKEGTDG